MPLTLGMLKGGGGTFEWLGTIVNDTSGTDYTFSSVNFGGADTSRLLVAAVHWISTSSAVSLDGTPTIGGVNATIHVQDSHTGGGSGLGAGILSSAVPTGTSGNVVLSFDSTIQRIEVSLFRAAGLVSNTPYDTLEVRGTNDTDINGTIDIPSNGALLIAGTGSTGTDGFPIAFTGATEVYDQDFVAGTGRIGAALSTGLGVETGRTCRFNMGTISNSGTEMMACSWQ